MCMQCVGAAGTALQAATVIGGPFAYAGYRRVRARLGLSDTAVAAQETQAAGAGSAPALASRSIASTTSTATSPPAQRRHSANVSSPAGGSWCARVERMTSQASAGPPSGIASPACPSG